MRGSVSNTNKRKPKQYRAWMAMLVALGLVAAACGSGSSEGSSDGTDADGTTGSSQEAGTAEGTLEVFSWWTSGGEEAALNELIATLDANNSNIKVENAAVAGGGGDAARAVLQTRLNGGDPPDTWQAHQGAEILDQYAKAGFSQGLKSLYEEEGWFDVIPEDIVESFTYEGEPHMVLAGVHRGNGFWYNKKLLDEQGIEIGDSLEIDEFFEIADQLQAEGIDPLCVGDSGIWASVELFENTLVGVLGADGYNGLWDGTTAFDSPEVKEAMETYKKFLSYQNDDHSALSWDQAVGKLMDGDCAFNSMGDWAFGEFNAAEKVEGEDFGWVSHPGSDGVFVAVSDGFTLAKDAPNEAATVEWLKAVGSLEGQTKFNQAKGSICVRTDCNREDFGDYHNWSMDSFEGDAIVPTVTHGSAAPAAFQQALNEAVTEFVVSGDVDAFSSKLVAAAKSSGIGE